MFFNEYVSWNLSQTESARVDPSWHEWTNQTASLCHANPRRSSPVNDAGALAPVVFSGQPEIETGKIREIKSSKVPYPLNRAFRIQWWYQFRLKMPLTTSSKLH